MYRRVVATRSRLRVRALRSARFGGLFADVRGHAVSAAADEVELQAAFDAQVAQDVAEVAFSDVDVGWRDHEGLVGGPCFAGGGESVLVLLGCADGLEARVCWSILLTLGLGWASWDFSP